MIVGLIYALLWEGVLAGYIPGVKTVSIRQWALAPAEDLLAAHPAWNVTSDVGLVPAYVLLAITFARRSTRDPAPQDLSVRVSE